MSISELIPGVGGAGTVSRRRQAPVLPTFPPIEPGQLWLAELPLASSSADDSLAVHLFAAVNVVIYDRSLAAGVAGSLTLGGYAEPATKPEETASRCVRFARDGWSVARLLPARLAPRERTRRVQDVVDELAAARLAGRLPVTIIAEADGITERLEARFDDLAAIVAGFPRDTRLAIVIDALGGVAASRPIAVAANGLAG